MEEQLPSRRGGGLVVPLCDERTGPLVDVSQPAAGISVRVSSRQNNPARARWVQVYQPTPAQCEARPKRLPCSSRF